MEYFNGGKRNYQPMRGNTDTSMQAYIHIAMKADKAILVFIMYVNRPVFGCKLQTLGWETSHNCSDLLLEMLK